MLVIFVVILLVVGLAIIGSLYSLFLPFFQQLSDIKQYNVAYYGAVSSVERGMLSLRYHGPGFETTTPSGWTEEDGNLGNYFDGVERLDFGALAEGDMHWSIRSRATTIPRAGEGNIPYAFLSSGASNDRLVLGYNNLMTYTLDLDQTTDASDYYRDVFSSARSTHLNSVALYAQLPTVLYTFYGGNTAALLADSCSPIVDCDWDGDNVDNDLVIDRSMNGDIGSNSFRIVPRVDVNYVSRTVNTNDNLIRENHINDTTVDDNDRTAERAHIVDPTAESIIGSPPPHNIISSSAASLQNERFSDLYSDSSISRLQLLFGLARMLYLPDGSMYPFLETRIKSDAPIADLYYHVDGVGRVGDYNVTIRVKKPTSNRGLLGSFTIVF